jgi:aminoglycoside phosphotransferase (APT) family kinase protein
MSATVAPQPVPAPPTAPSLSADDADLVARERALPGLATLLDDVAFATVLDEAYPEAGVRAAQSTYTRLKPGTNCLVAYDVETAAGATRVYARTHPRRDAGKLAAVRRARARGPLGRGGALLEAPLVAIYPFPNDRRLTALAALGEHEARARLLGRLSPPGSALAAARLSTIRHKPERRFVGLLETSEGERAVVKAFAHRSSLPSGAIAHLASARGPRLPRSLGASADGRLLLSEWLPGDPLDALARAGLSIGTCAAHAGRALAELHALPIERLAASPRGSPGLALGQAARAVAALCPSLHPGTRELAERLTRRLGAHARSGTEEVLVHGDFSADQVLVDGSGGVALIDLDEAGRGRRALDLGSFLARLELEVLEGRLPLAVAGELGANLLGGYAEASGVPTREIGMHTAASLLQLAPEPFRHRRRDWATLVAAAVDRARELEAGDRPLGLAAGAGQ